MKKIYILLLVLGSFAIEAQASGGGGGGGGGGGSFGGSVGGGGGGPRAPRKVSSQRFEAGQAIFEGKIDTKPNSSLSKVSLSTRNSQARNLGLLKRKLAKTSPSAADQLDVEKLASNLNSTEIRALKYYLDVRFLKTEDYDSEFNQKGKKKRKNRRRKSNDD